MVWCDVVVCGVTPATAGTVLRTEAVVQWSGLVCWSGVHLVGAGCPSVTLGLWDY